MLYIFVVEDYPTGTIQIKEEIHLVDMVPLTLILRETKYFQTPTKSKENFTQIVYCDIVIN